MTDKELRRLRKNDLLAMLKDSEGQIEVLKKQHAAEKAELEASLSRVEAELENRDITLDEVGSIAEAAEKIQNVFAAAQRTADQRLTAINERLQQVESVCRSKEEESLARAEEMIAESEEKCVRIGEQAQQQADAMIAEAKLRKQETEVRCAEIVETAKRESQNHWQEASVRLEEIIRSHEYLENLLKDTLRRAAQSE